MDEQNDQELSSLIKAKAIYHQAPPGLRANIVAAVKQFPPPRTRKRTDWLWQSWQHAAGLGAAFAAGMLLTLGILYRPPLQPAEERMAQEVTSSHVRSLMGAHLADVISSDQHTVKPWFSGKLDYAPPVHDLAAEGFPLVGGRLDYVDQRPVAALVYRRHQHTINVFVWPIQGSILEEPRLVTRQGFNLMRWSQSGMQFWAASDLGGGEMQTFVELLKRAEALPVSGVGQPTVSK